MDGAPAGVVQEPEPPFSQPPAGQQPVRARNPFGGHQADQRTRLLRLQERRRRAIGFWLVLAFLLLCVMVTVVVLSNVSDLDIPLLQALRFQ